MKKIPVYALSWCVNKNQLYVSDLFLKENHSCTTVREFNSIPHWKAKTTSQKLILLFRKVMNLKIKTAQKEQSLIKTQIKFKVL